MNRTFKTSRTPVTQYNRYAEWIRCHWCGHTHAKIVYSAVCCATMQGEILQYGRGTSATTSDTLDSARNATSNVLNSHSLQ